MFAVLLYHSAVTVNEEGAGAAGQIKDPHALLQRCYLVKPIDDKAH